MKLSKVRRVSKAFIACLVLTNAVYCSAQSPSDSEIAPPILVSVRPVQSGLAIAPPQDGTASPSDQKAVDAPEKSTGPVDRPQTVESPQSVSGLNPIPMQSVRTPIEAVDIGVADIGTKVIPTDEAAMLANAIIPLPDGVGRGFGYIQYRWQAANTCHVALYFEEPMLERHGQQRCPTYLQPAVSGTKFLSNLALLPYKATLWPANEGRYTLGHFRPGSPAPLLRDTLPWSPRAAAVQGLAASAVVVGLPW